MYDTIYTRLLLNNSQLDKIKSILCKHAGSIETQNKVLRASILNMITKFVTNINKDHKNLVYCVENHTIVNIALYVCDPRSLYNYHVYTLPTDKSDLPFTSLHGLSASSAELMMLVLDIEKILGYYGSPNQSISDVFADRSIEKKLLKLDSIGSINYRFRNSRSSCTKIGDYYLEPTFNGYCHYVRIDDKEDVFVLLPPSIIKKLNYGKSKNQLQRTETPNGECECGSILYGRRDEFKYSTGRHCDQASAKGKGIRVGGYKVNLSTRLAKVFGCKG